MPTSAFTALLIALTAPLVLYVVEGWREPTVPSSRVDSEDFFFASRSLSLSDYAVTTVAYGLQMAAVVLFAQWGYYYGYQSLLVPAAWCSGFLLLAAFSGKLDQFLQSSKSLHGFLGDSHGRSSGVVRIAALATVLGLGGALFAELRYTADLIQHLLGRGENFRYLLMFFFLAACLAYVLPGGFRAVVTTDQRQLPIAYAGLAVLLASLLYALAITDRPSAGASIIGIGSFAAIAATTYWGLVQGRRRFRTGDFVALIVPLLSLSAVVFALALPAANPATPQNLNIQMSAWEPQSMPWLTIASLVFANGLWQLVDLSAFQRLTGLRLPDQPIDRVRLLRKAIVWTSLESPVSWCVGVAIGVALGQLGAFGAADGAWTAYEQYLGAVATGTGVGSIFSETTRAVVLGASLAALVAIMLSTVDSIGSSITLTTTADLIAAGSTARSITMVRSRVATFLVLASLWALFAIWQRFLSAEHDISAWLYVAYAMQLSLFPVAFCALSRIPLQSWAAQASIITGLITSIGVGGWLAQSGNPDVFVFPPLVAITVSTMIVILYVAGKQVAVALSRTR